MVELLLKHGANVDGVDHDFRTALQSAAWQGHGNVVTLLLGFGADVDHTCNQGATALCIAAQEGHESVVTKLLQFRANPNHVDQYSRTATRVALKGGHMNVVKILEKHGATNTNGNGTSTTTSGVSVTMAADAKTTVSSKLLAQAAALANGQLITITNSPTDSLGSTYDRRKSYMSNNSSKSSMTASNTASTNQSSSSGGGGGGDSAALSFTQQLQQCSVGKNRNRSLTRILSPVSEPQSPENSVGVSPLSELQNTFAKIAQDVKSLTRRRVSSPNVDNKMKSTEEPIWQRQPNTGTCGVLNVSKSEPGILSSQVPKSPDTRRKRNGIVTNPKCAKPPVVTRYHDKFANISDAIDSYPACIRSLQSSVSKKASRPNGLPLKKETPL